MQDMELALGFPEGEPGFNLQILPVAHSQALQ